MGGFFMKKRCENMERIGRDNGGLGFHVRTDSYLQICLLLIFLKRFQPACQPVSIRFYAGCITNG